VGALAERERDQRREHDRAQHSSGCWWMKDGMMYESGAQL
jgi:hypothetical protein